MTKYVFAIILKDTTAILVQKNIMGNARCVLARIIFTKNLLDTKIGVHKMDRIKEQLNRARYENLIQDELCRCQHSIDVHGNLGSNENNGPCEYCNCKGYVWQKTVIKKNHIILLKCHRHWRSE